MNGHQLLVLHVSIVTIAELLSSETKGACCTLLLPEMALAAIGTSALCPLWSLIRPYYVEDPWVTKSSVSKFEC